MSSRTQLKNSGVDMLRLQRNRKSSSCTIHKNMCHGYKTNGESCMNNGKWCGYCKWHIPKDETTKIQKWWRIIRMKFIIRRMCTKECVECGIVCNITKHLPNSDECKNRKAGVICWKHTNTEFIKLKCRVCWCDHTTKNISHIGAEYIICTTPNWRDCLYLTGTEYRGCTDFVHICSSTCDSTK